MSYFQANLSFQHNISERVVTGFTVYILFNGYRTAAIGEKELDGYFIICWRESFQVNLNFIFLYFFPQRRFYVIDKLF